MKIVGGDKLEMIGMMGISWSRIIILTWILMIPGTSQGLNVYVFWRMGCPYCDQALLYLHQLDSQHPEYGLQIHEFEVTQGGNPQLFKQFLEEFHVDPQLRGYVPAIFMANRSFIGFDPQIRIQLKSTIEYCAVNPCPDLGAGILARHQLAPPGVPIWIWIGIGILGLMLILILKKRK